MLIQYKRFEKFLVELWHFGSLVSLLSSGNLYNSNLVFYNESYYKQYMSNVSFSNRRPQHGTSCIVTWLLGQGEHWEGMAGSKAHQNAIHVSWCAGRVSWHIRCWAGIELGMHHISSGGSCLLESNEVAA